MSTEAFSVFLKLYPTEIQVAAKKRELWIHKSEGDKIPKAIRDNMNDGKAPMDYYYDVDGWVIDASTNQKVIRNKRTAGKPNMERISGQAIWDGSVARFARNRLKKYLSDYFIPILRRQLPVIIKTKPNTYFHFEFIFYTNLKSKSQDIDNHAYPYVKSFIDTIVHLQIITDDGPTYCRGYYCRYVGIPEEQERRLIVKLHFCENNQRIS